MVKLRPSGVVSMNCPRLELTEATDPMTEPNMGGPIGANGGTSGETETPLAALRFTERSGWMMVLRW